jgi:hypothetical protein
MANVARNSRHQGLVADLGISRRTVGDALFEMLVVMFSAARHPYFGWTSALNGASLRGLKFIADSAIECLDIKRLPTSALYSGKSTVFVRQT